jgi:hypothetical protein
MLYYEEGLLASLVACLHKRDNEPTNQTKTLEMTNIRKKTTIISLMSHHFISL